MVKFCYNCFRNTHVTRQCQFPVSSFGVVCFQKRDELKYLMVERKYSFNYSEFIQGKYNVFQVDYLQSMFNQMTTSERDLILQNDFEILWSRLFFSSRSRDYNSSRIKFSILKGGYSLKASKKLVSLDSLINKCDETFEDAEWFFPKGKRKNPHEEDQSCAIREFEEETSLSKDIINLTEKTFSDAHYGSNRKKYKVKFWLAEITEDVPITVPDNHPEISNMMWLTYDECLNKFRNYENKKKSLMDKIHKEVSQKLIKV